jgi:succinyl-CoA synthetase alpha subunit
MGHAGAIVAGGKGTAREKMETMAACGILVCESPADLGSTIAKALEA